MSEPSARDGVVVCVAGWHLGVEVFRRLKNAAVGRVHLASHRPLAAVPEEIVELLGMDCIHVFPNRGYDWGAYGQFCDAGLHRGGEFCFFMHDDVEIIDTNLFREAVEQLKAGAIVVGNGRNSERNNWFALGEGHSYAHARELPPDMNFAHATVRGSFLAMRSRTIDELGGFDVFWDPWRLMVETGNLSLIATCGRIAARYGDAAFSYLGDSECRSKYMIEAIRGGAAPERRWNIAAKVKAQIFKLYKRTALALVRQELDRKDRMTFSMRLRRRFVAFVSGNDSCLERGVAGGDR
jgi:hypothetical protein